MNTLRIIGQLVLIIIFGFAACLLLHFKIPGNQTFTDNDAGPLVLVYGIFLILGFGLLINTIVFKVKNHLNKFRIAVLIFVIGCMIVVFIPRDLFVAAFLGNKKSEYISSKEKVSDYIWVKLELFENNKFLCSSSNIHLTVQNIGVYEIKNTILNLSFENKKSEFIGTKFEIKNDTLYCVDCNFSIKLIKK